MVYVMHLIRNIKEWFEAAIKRYVMDKLFLGIDVGSYESKGVVVDQLGKVIAFENIGHSLSFPKPGYVEHDADGIWWKETRLISQKLLSNPKVNPKKIAAVGISSIAPCVLPIDETGHPLRPGILYGIDNRATQQIRAFEEEYGEKKIYEICGQKLSSQAAGPKILWIRNNEPDIWEKTWKILTGSGYLVYKLTGNCVLDKYTASAYSPLFDIQTLNWSMEFEKYIPVRILPDLYWTTDIGGYVNAQASRETGIPEGIPVVVGSADAAVESLSAGLSNIGDMMLMYGSSTFIIQKTKKLVLSSEYTGAVFLQEGHFVLAGGLSTAGSLTRWFRDQFGYYEMQLEHDEGINAYKSLSSLANKSPKGANGVMVLPFFSGQLNNPSASGVIYGLSLTNTRADIYRALLESIGYFIRENLERMISLGNIPTKVIAVGGGIKNLPWLQIVSDITGITQFVPDCTYGACYGDAFIAAIGVGEFNSISEISKWVKDKYKVVPDKKSRGIYDNKYWEYKQLCEKMYS
jgi:xylulokinase